MANIKVGIVEDEMIIADGIADALRQLGYTPTAPAANYTTALEMLERERPDIVLVDIVLSGKKDGIDLAWKIKELYGLPFIFLTANSDTATVERAKQVQPNAYLVKPFHKDELYTSIEICLHSFSSAHASKEVTHEGNYIIKDSLFIKQGTEFHKVKLDDILYLESDNVYIYVYTTSQKFLVRSTMQDYLELINRKDFLKVHRSFAVNINHIQTIGADNIVVGNKEIPVSRSHRDELLKAIRLG